MSSGVFSFRVSTGIFRETKYIIVFTAILNLNFSVVFGKLFGLRGILISGILARLLTNICFEPYVLIKRFFNSDFSGFIIRQIIYYLVATIVVLCLFYLGKIIMHISWVYFL